MDTFEAGIIGGGIHGVCAAVHLASQSVPTVLFERSTPAGGPTGRSSAVCRAFYTNEFLAGVARESMDVFTDFAAWSGGRSADFETTGIWFLHPEADVDAVRANAARLNALGTRTELFEGDALAAALPGFALDDVAIGAFEAGAGYADPSTTTRSVFDRAVELGLTARLHTGIAAIEPAAGGGAVVVADDGTRTACRRLLIAAGPWSGPLARMVGVDLPLIVERHIVATFGWGAADPVTTCVGDLPGGYYLKPEGRDLFCLGPLDAGAIVDPDDFDHEVADAECAELAAAVVERIPALAGSEARGGWASLYDVSPDWQPVIGEIADGIFVDAGTSGHGFKLAPALGRHVADLVIGKPVDPGLEQFAPGRFAAGRALTAGYGDIRILG